jgi:hypothetical protein
MYVWLKYSEIWNVRFEVLSVPQEHTNLCGTMGQSVNTLFSYTYMSHLVPRWDKGDF